MIFLVAGGTGGHVFPALALADILKDQGYASLLLTDKRGARFVPGGANHRVIDQRRNLGLIGEMRRLISTHRPEAVVGFGGSFTLWPLVVAWWSSVAIFIHEQNAVFGRANRVVSVIARRIGLGYRQTAKIPFWAKQCCVFTGLPLRASFGPFVPPEPIAKRMRILIVGGSQGARIFSTLVPEAFAALPKALRERFMIRHQCRSEDLDELVRRWQDLGVQASVKTFFSDMERELSWCHVVVSRAGAGSLAEIRHMRRPAIIIPFAAAVDNHQRANALQLAQRDALWVVDEDNMVDLLTKRLKSLAMDPGKVAQPRVPMADPDQTLAAMIIGSTPVAAMGGT